MSFQEHWFQGRLVELSREECLELLASQPVGRVSYVDEHGPVVIPVTHEVDGDTVVFRTTRHSKLATAAGPGLLAFEVDDIDPFDQSGWSVLVRGNAHFEEIPDLDDDTVEAPVPWVQGRHSLLVRIAPRSMTGRRLLAS